MQEMEGEIVQFTTFIWKSILKIDVKKVSDDFKASGKENTLAGCVQITGAWEGTVALQCSVTLAQRAATIMYAGSGKETAMNEVLDALGELANITGGNIKSLLPPPCYLSLPAVAVTDFNLHVPGSSLLTKVNFKCDDDEGEYFMVTLLKKADEPN